jgi:hypothetical protein
VPEASSLRAAALAGFIAAFSSGLAAAGAAPSDPAPSYLSEVVPLFTRLGCNQGACHGKLAGQNGFHLSLRGYAPEEDYLSLTRELFARRINPAFPEESLLLRKPLGQLPHGGGNVFRKGSREHQLLLDWLRAGMPGPAKGEPEVVRLEIFPGNRTLRVGEEISLEARAWRSDGSARDVTWLTRFESNDRSVVEASLSGRCRVLRSGETAVRASYLTQVAVVLLTAPRELPGGPAPPETPLAVNNFIDLCVGRKLAGLGIEPSGPASDAEFLRRAFLDTIGRLPSSEEARSFLADSTPQKRGRLVDELLERPEFIDYSTMLLADLLQNRRERDHDARGAKGVRGFHSWLRRQVAANRPWNELARELITASGSASENPAVGYYIVTVGERGQADQSEAVASVAQAFLGTRILCCQCHNHPLEKYTQDDYYHFAAFFSRMRLERRELREGATRLLAVAGDPQADARPVGVPHPRTGRFLVPQPLDRSAVVLKPGEDPRQKLADWITGPGNEYFSGAMVNRIWKQFFGVGLVEPVDDLRESNPPSNPELWRALREEFVTSGFDRKHLMRLILKSAAYGLGSATRSGNENDGRFFSHYYVRRLPAEVLLDALSQATGAADSFPGYPGGLRAVQLPDPALKSYFLSLFGRPERVTACACERTSEVTMPQLLHLQNGESVVAKIQAPGGLLRSLLDAKRRDPEIVEELFLSALARRPGAEELQAVGGSLAGGASREEALSDLFWALLNSKEFAFNH